MVRSRPGFIFAVPRVLPGVRRFGLLRLHGGTRHVVCSFPKQLVLGHLRRRCVVDWQALVSTYHPPHESPPVQPFHEWPTTIIRVARANCEAVPDMISRRPRTNAGSTLRADKALILLGGICLDVRGSCSATPTRTGPASRQHADLLRCGEQVTLVGESASYPGAMSSPVVS